MIDRAKLRLSCPLCSSPSYLRVNAYTDVSATAWSDGECRFGFDYSDPELDPLTEISCHRCSVVLSLEKGDNNTWQLVRRAESPSRSEIDS